LECHDNALVELPTLPPKLESLHCGNNPMIYPPPEVSKNYIPYIRDWMEKNPLTFVKSANKV
jgi:hypothetical protein